MTQYSDELDAFLDTLFPPEHLDDVLGEVVADADIPQLRIAETEKYPHVTYFLNGGRETPFPARTASWCRRRRSPPTTCSRKCRPRS